MLTDKQEQRLRRALPDFSVYEKARYIGEDTFVCCGTYSENVKQLRHNRTYTGTFIVFPNAAICNVLQNVYIQTNPKLWAFMEEE